MSTPIAREEAGIAEAVRPLLPALRRIAKADAEQGREFRWIPQLTPRRAFPPAGNRGLYSVTASAGSVVDGGSLPLRRHRFSEPWHYFAPVGASRTTPGIFQRLRSLPGAQRSRFRVGLNDRLGNEEARRYRLEDTLQKWIRVFDRAGWGAAIVDAEDQRIEAVNPAFAALHGYPTPEA